MRGWCTAHYQRWRRLGDPVAGGLPRSIERQSEYPCRADGCEKRAHATGLCAAHYLRVHKYGDIDADNRRKVTNCSIEGCEAPHAARGWCTGHYDRWRRYGDPLAEANRPKRGWVTSKGYRLVWRPDHPNRDKRGYVAEHIAVMAEAIGRPLVPGENVHHKNGVRDDNRLENLELWLSSQPAGQRVRDLIAFANSITEQYGTDPSAFP